MGNRELGMVKFDRPGRFLPGFGGKSQSFKGSAGETGGGRSNSCHRISPVTVGCC
ncbi:MULTISPECIES: hypothetical protein [Microcoleaceae]|uniref:hypothetical protein n=1 Tax=Microcoleaceae TaxID=1892252 RepID=UPI00187EECD4|nr:hypothetical protein [Tychonema sp. LEGE 06208]MBE9164951.1 hypothetical protein [Tychonema sp. LEGE 06208]